MRTFDFIVDNKATIWYRENFCIEAKVKTKQIELLKS